MSIFSNNTNISIDKNIFEELCKYVYPKDIKKTVETLITQYINSKKTSDVNILITNDFAKADNISSKMTKACARSLFQKKGYSLYNSCTFASTNAASGFYWANPNPEFLNYDWSLILHNPREHTLYLLNIPKNTFSIKDFYLRSGAIPNLSINPSTLIDAGPGKVNFSSYIIAKINYEEYVF